MHSAPAAFQRIQLAEKASMASCESTQAKRVVTAKGKPKPKIFSATPLPKVVGLRAGNSARLETPCFASNQVIWVGRRGRSRGPTLEEGPTQSANCPGGSSNASCTDVCWSFIG